MIFACTEEHFHDECPHEFKMFYQMLRNRQGKFIGALWVCEQCLHRVDPPGTPPREEHPDLTLFDLTEEPNRDLDKHRADHNQGGA